jgi:hypothetical protein
MQKEIINNTELETVGSSGQLEPLVSPLARKVIKCLKDYNGIAETGNIQYELGMTGRMIANIMRPLIRRGLVKILGRGCNMETEFGGSTYELTGKSG